MVNGKLLMVNEKNDFLIRGHPLDPRHPRSIVFLSSAFCLQIRVFSALTSASNHMYKKCGFLYISRSIYINIPVFYLFGLVTNSSTNLEFM